MRAIRLIFAAVIGTGMLVVGGAGTALACSCAMASTADYVDYADVVVTGTLTNIELPPEGPVISSGDPVTYTVQVEQTFKGDPQSELTFTSARYGASCGLEGMQVDRRYTFFLNGDGDQLFGSLCSGTQPATGAFDVKLAHIAGPPVEAAGNLPPADPSAQAAVDGDDATADSAIPAWVYAALAGGVVVLVGGLVGWRRYLAHETAAPRAHLY
jgi:hypothetical protein